MVFLLAVALSLMIISPCEANTTISNTSETSAPTTTQTLPVTNPILSNADSKATLIPLNTDLAVCTCDLTQQVCDINCCCDNDCTSEDRVVFSTCVDELTSADNSNLCSYTVKEYANYEVSSKSINNPFFFCIWRDTNVERNYYTPVSLANDNASFAERLSRFNGYTYEYDYGVPNVPPSPNNYKSGQLMVTLTSGRPGVLYLPAAVGSSSSCVDKSPAKFLHDFSGSCMRSLQKRVKDVCSTEASFSSEQLDQDLRNMRIKKRPDTSVDAADVIRFNVSTPVQPSYDSLTNTCEGVLSEVHYKITHKDGVLVSVEVSTVLSDISGDLIAVEQKYSISFVESDEFLFHRSGNPGYLVGEPVLAGKKVGDYIALNGNREEYLRMVTASADGNCVTDLLQRQPILFGIDFRSGCMWRLTSNDLNQCSDIKSQVVEALLGPSRSLDTDGSLYLASFGNSNPLQVGDWVPVLVSDQLGTSDCVGASLHLEILYARVGALNNPQARIVGAKLVIKAVTPDFLCVGPYCQSQNEDATQNVEMVTSVAFVDVSEVSQPVIAERRVSQAKLPADFFHPYYAEPGST